MKKLLGVLCAFVLLFGLSACSLFGGNKEDNGGGNGGNSIFNSTKTLTCTKTETDEDDGSKTENTVVVTYKGDSIKKIVNTSVSDLEPEYVEFAISLGKAIAEEFNKVDGLTITYSATNSGNALKVETIIDCENLDVSALSELTEDLVDENSLESSFYNAKDTKIEDLKKEIEEDGFTCK